MSDLKVICPVCNSENHVRLFPEYEGKALSSDWYLHEKVEIYNACCKDCGNIYEASGIRNFSFDFYDKVFKPKPMMKVFGKKTSVSRQSKAYDLINEHIPLEATGKVLEAGAGMGGFSSIFCEKHPEWEVTSFEPSASFDKLKENTKDFENISIRRAGYEDVELEEGYYDVIVSLGVLEHVSNPLQMVKWASNGLKEGGYLFLEFPNFEFQPNDLLCVDHLSKITPEFMKVMAKNSGLEVLNVIKQGVPVYFVFKKNSAVKEDLSNCYEENIKIAKSNEDVLKKTMDAIKEAHSTAKANGENFAIFGLATAGLMAPYYLDFDPQDISIFIDENSGLWNTEMMGREVKGLDYIYKNQIKHIALAISPAYTEAVKEKLSDFDLTVYSA